MPPGYEHHIFISHRKSHQDNVRWVRDCFVRVLTSHISRFVDHPKVFFDETHIESGDEWPAKLATAHATSCILVPVLDPTYFTSKWCRLELELMRAREKLVASKTGSRPRLIFPVTINDGDDFPTDIRAIQQLSLHELSCPYIQPESGDFAKLAKVVAKWSEGRMKDSLKGPPPWDDGWRQLALKEFDDVYRMVPGVQTTLPQHSHLVIPP